MWLGLVGAIATPAAARAGELTLVCYLRQSGAGSQSSFIRRVEIDFAAGTVSIADSAGAGFVPLGHHGKLLPSDKNVLSFDYASASSSGRSTINRTDGSYYFADQKFVTRGTCSTSETNRTPF